ncbi:hypothetical protein T440DRAFT_104518 [Plenodomus tracheiphilus IPT5]|uniref:Uncharacterized protein n=1 Tax=Plenodomus tracheiphilus IPT5 TaxID=1408161 RepID=A0A6A7BLD9_9PLEO|nr:hypothetical protein T440DRAFT_104518 [Plenodomus tracheiphilus IPT5]
MGTLACCAVLGCRLAKRAKCIYGRVACAVLGLKEDMVSSSSLPVSRRGCWWRSGAVRACLPALRSAAHVQRAALGISRWRDQAIGPDESRCAERSPGCACVTGHGQQPIACRARRLR